MKSRILVLSILVNVTLAAGLIWTLTVQRRTTPPPAPVTAPIESPRARTEVRPVPVVVNSAKTNFHWSQVESPNYLAYVANLRAIGCPEETIRDIIIADINKLFAPRYASLAASAPELAWWGRFDKRKPTRAELTAQLRALDEEKKAILVRLLGVNALVDSAFADSTAGALREQGAFAFLPAAKQSAVHDLVSRYETLREWGETQWKGLPSDDRDAKLKELRDARARELATLLTPEELREFDLRDSLTANTLREQFGRANLTEAEFRKMYELRRDFEQRNPVTQIEDWKRLEADYTAALGADRYADLRRQNDAMWRAMQSLAAAQNLTPDAMQQAYAIHQAYADRLAQAVGQMFADPQQNPQPLRDLATERDSQLQALIGANALRELDRLGALPRLVVQDDGQRRSYSLSRSGFSD